MGNIQLQFGAFEFPSSSVLITGNENRADTVCVGKRFSRARGCTGNESCSGQFIEMLFFTGSR